MTRRIVQLAGNDALTFLQGVVSNDVRPLAHGPGLVWTALLSAQGKYLADFFVVNTGAELLLDLPEVVADATLQRLSMYRLRADVQMLPVDLPVTRGLGTPPPGALPDPRHPALGWRLYGTAQTDAVDWDAVRVAHLIPETGAELLPGESYILECGFERLHGVDFRKGCYVGQEVTARMKHKTDLRKGLIRVKVSAPVPLGTPIMSDGREVGAVYTQSGGQAIAYLRLDRSTGPLVAGTAAVVPI